MVRPMGIGELLEAALGIVRRRFRTLALCVLVVVAPLSVLSTIVQLAAVDGAFDYTTDTNTITVEGSDAAGTIAAALIAAIGVVLATGACFRAVEADVRGESTTWQQSLAYAARRLVPLVLAGIVFVFGVALGFVLCIVPGIYLMVAWSLSAPAVLYEDRGPLQSLGRSQALIKGHWWRVFGAELLMLLAVTLVQALIGGLIGAIVLTNSSDEAVNAVAATVATVLGYVVSLPLQSALFGLLYFELRARRGDAGAGQAGPQPFEAPSWPPPEAPAWQPPQPPGGFLPPQPPRS